MASTSIDSKGNVRIQVMVGGKRKSIRVGKLTDKQARSVAESIQSLANSVNHGTILDGVTAKWLATRPQSGYAKLVAAGLAEPRDDQAYTLHDLLERYFNSLNVKDVTVVKYGQCRKALEKFFGARRALRTITPSEAEAFRKSVKESGKAQATVSKFVKIARGIFARGVRWKMISESPFADVVAGTQRNPSRLMFVPRAQVERLLDVCSDPQMRLLIALARYGALRVPSEPNALRWEHVDWENSRLTVPSVKTEAQGKAARVIPIFPELRPHLLAAYEAAPEGAEYVIQGRRDAGINYRTALLRLMARAGVQPWPKVWQQMRASRATELANEFPAHVATAWCGHTYEVALSHYWQVSDDDYLRAVQIPAQHGPESTRNDPRTNKPLQTEGLGVLELAHSCGSTRDEGMPPEGLEPSTR
jgi:integrase